MQNNFLSSPIPGAINTNIPPVGDFILNTTEDYDKKLSIAVIGGGIAGCTTALRLTKQGHKVTIFESANQLLSGSSDATPCRLGVGFHYMDRETAFLTLETNINLIRYLIQTTGFDFSVRNYQNGELFPKRIYYVVMKDSIVSPSEIKMLFNDIRQHYAELIEKNFANSVFGPPADFYREINKSELQDIIDTDRVDTVYDTCESLFNWPLLKSYITGKLHNDEDITIHKQIKVLAFRRTKNLTVEVISNKKKEEFDFVINASWYSTDLLNKTLGGEVRQTQTINRIKCMTEVEVPDHLQNKSFLFAYGPFCALSTRYHEGKHLGYLTYEKVTNIMQIPGDQEFTPEQERYVTGNLTEEEKFSYGKKIIEGASQFLAGLKTSDYRNLKLGVVRTDGGVIDICAKDKHFKRTFMGVYQAKYGVIVNECRKHTYWYENSRTTVSFLNDQIEMRKVILQLYDQIMIADGIAKIFLLRCLADQIDSLFITGNDKQTPSPASLTSDLFLFKTTCLRKAAINDQIIAGRDEQWEQKEICVTAEAPAEDDEATPASYRSF